MGEGERLAGKNRRTRGGSRRQEVWLSSGETGTGAGRGERPEVVPGRRPSYFKGQRSPPAMRYVKWTLIVLSSSLSSARCCTTNLPQRDIRADRLYRGPPGRSWNERLLLLQRGMGGIPTTRQNRGRVLHRDHSPERSPIFLPQRGYGLGVDAPISSSNSANLQAIARDLESTQDEPALGGGAPLRLAGRGVLDLSRNATSIQSVNGPDARLIPWTSITILYPASRPW